MKIIKKISLAILGIYYILVVARIILPQLVQIDVSYAIGFVFGIYILYASPVAVLAIILICLSLYLSYKREALKPSILFLVVLIILSYLPIKFTFQFVQLFNQSRQISAQISAIYTDEIPVSMSAQLYIPNATTVNLIDKDFEPYFTEAKKDGTYYVNIYKKRNEKIDAFGQAVRSFLKDPSNVGLIFYPNSYIQFYGSTIGNDTQKHGYKNCISIGSIMDIGFDISDAENGIHKVYEENLGDTKLTLYQLKIPNVYYKANFKRGDSCSVIDFSNMPGGYTLEKIIEISKSFAR